MAVAFPMVGSSSSFWDLSLSPNDRGLGFLQRNAGFGKVRCFIVGRGAMHRQLMGVGAGWEALKRCYTENGKAKMGRRWFECITCNILQLKSNPTKLGGPFSGKVICVVCAENCHRGHQLHKCQNPVLGIVSTCGCGSAGVPCLAKGQPPPVPFEPEPIALELEARRKGILREIQELDRRLIPCQREIADLLALAVEDVLPPVQRAIPHEQLARLMGLQEELLQQRRVLVQQAREIEAQLNAYFLTLLRPSGRLTGHNFRVYHVSRPLNHPLIPRVVLHNEIILVDEHGMIISSILLNYDYTHHKTKGRWWIAAWHPHGSAEDVLEREVAWDAFGAAGAIHFRPQVVRAMKRYYILHILTFYLGTIRRTYRLAAEL